MKYKINEEKLKEVLKPYGLWYKGGEIYGMVLTSYKYEQFLDFNDRDSDRIMQDIKYGSMNGNWKASIKLLIPILHNCFNEVFEPLYTHGNVLDCLRKLKLNVENGYVKVTDVCTGKKYNSVRLDDLLNVLNGNKKIKECALLAELVKNNIER